MARGNLGSYPIEEIVERCRQSFREGVKEIWMTSEDTGERLNRMESKTQSIRYSFTTYGHNLRFTWLNNAAYIVAHSSY